MSKLSTRSRFILFYCFLFGIIWGLYTTSGKETKPLQGNLNLLIIENSIPEDVIEGFQLETRNKTKVTFVKNEAEGLELLNLNAQKFDVVTLMSHQIERLINIKKLVPIDQNQVQNNKNVGIDFKHPPFDEDARYTVPVIWGINGYILNKDKVENDVNSLDEIFQGKYKKKIYIHNSPFDILTNLFKRNKIDTTSVIQSNIHNIDAAVKDLSEYITRSPASDVKEQLLKEDVWIAQMDSGVASEFIEKNGKFKYLIPEEGATLWTVSLAIVNGSENLNEAHQFLNYVMKKEVSREIANISKRAVTNILVEDAKIHASLKPSYLRHISVHNLRYYNEIGAIDPKIQNLFNVSDAEKVDNIQTE